MSSFQFGRAFTIKPTSEHTATVIFLHGLGDTGQSWSQSMGKLDLNHVKFICPTAPSQPVTLNGGFQMPSWFDIRGLDPASEEDGPGIERASMAVKNLIDAEIAAGIPPSRIVIGGFSQGGATAIFTALTMDKDVAGVAVLSTWLPLHARFPGAAKSNLATPMFQCHGKADPIVPFQWGKLTAGVLASINSQHQFHEYSAMGHHSNDAEMKDLKLFLSQALPDK